MQLKLSLSQKALLLVVIPLSAELVVIATLGILLRQLEVDAGRLERSRAIIGGASTLTKLAFDASTSLVAYNLSKSPVFAQSYERSIEQIPQELEFLKRLAGNDQNDSRDIERIQGFANHGMQLLKETKAKQDEQEAGVALDLLSGVGLAGDVQKTLSDLLSAVDELVARQKHLERSSPESQSRVRGMLEMALVAGVLLNLAIAIGLTVFFNRSTSQRLSLLMENTRRLARAEALSPPVGGADEISDLDTTFRDMAGALEESNRLKREFLEMVSHDVRTPLASVMAVLEIIEFGVSPQTMSSDLSVAKRNLTQVITLLNELLDIHRMESGKLKLSFVETGAAEILEEAIETVMASAQLADISISVPDNPVTVVCDADRLRQVFINLLSNALKFSPSGGHIETAIDVTPDWIKIVIRDQGPGVPAEFKDRIFDRFQQVQASDEKQKGGRGLGLAICKAIVEEHEGQIGVDDADGGGSEFWVLLPKRKELPARQLTVDADPNVSRL